MAKIVVCHVWRLLRDHHETTRNQSGNLNGSLAPKHLFIALSGRNWTLGTSHLVALFKLARTSERVKLFNKAIACVYANDYGASLPVKIYLFEAKIVCGAWAKSWATKHATLPWVESLVFFFAFRVSFLVNHKFDDKFPAVVLAPGSSQKEFLWVAV